MMSLGKIMAQDILKLTLEVVDRLAGLQKMINGLQTVNNSLFIVNINLNNISNTNSFLKLASQISIAKNALGAFKSVLGGVGSLLDVGKGFFEKVIEGQKFKQDTLIKFKSIFKDEAEAAKQYQNLFAIANQTPGTVEGLRGATETFAASRFTLPEIETLQGIYADIDALFGKDLGQNFVSAIAKIKGQGKLTGEALGFEAIEKLGREPLLLDIGKQLKITGTKQQILDKVNKEIKGGKVSANLAITSIINVEKELTGIKQVGEFAKKMGVESLSGAFSNVQEGLDNLFRTLDLKNMPALTQFFANISDALKDPAIKKSLEDAVDSLIEPLKTISKDDIASVFRTVAGFINDAAKGIVELFNYVKRIKNEGLQTLLSDAVVGMKDVLLYIGVLIAKGIKKGLTGGDDIIAEFERKRQESELKRNVQKFGGSYVEGGVSSYSYMIGPNGEHLPVPAPKTALSTVSAPNSPIDPNKPANWVMNISVDASGSDNPDEIANKVAQKAKQAVNDAHKTARTAARTKGLSN